MQVLSAYGKEIMDEFVCIFKEDFEITLKAVCLRVKNWAFALIDEMKSTIT
jgi:hypothetical protein